jgi:hypothetical protein
MNPPPTAGRCTTSGHRQIQQDSSPPEAISEFIDRETGVRELVDVLEDIISEPGDLIESRSPEFFAQAHGMIRRFGDEVPRQAE